MDSRRTNDATIPQAREKSMMQRLDLAEGFQEGSIVADPRDRIAAFERSEKDVGV